MIIPASDGKQKYIAPGWWLKSLFHKIGQLCVMIPDLLTKLFTPSFVLGKNACGQCFQSIATASQDCVPRAQLYFQAILHFRAKPRKTSQNSKKPAKPTIAPKSHQLSTMCSRKQIGILDDKIIKLTSLKLALHSRRKRVAVVQQRKGEPRKRPRSCPRLFWAVKQLSHEAGGRYLTAILTFYLTFHMAYYFIGHLILHSISDI